MFSRAPCTTLAVMLSMASVTLLLLQPQDQIAARVRRRRGARRHDNRRVGLQNDRRPGERLAERQRGTSIERRRECLQLTAGAKDAGCGLDQSFGEAGAEAWTWRCDLWHPTDAGHADVDDLDRAVGEDMAVFEAMLFAEEAEYRRDR